MKGWIIYKRAADELTDFDHGIMRFLQAAKKLDIQLDVYKPEEFDLIVAGQNPNEICLRNKWVPLPNFILPRMGADTNFHALNLLRQFEYQKVPCINSATSIDAVRDKMGASQLLARSNLPIPKTMLLKFPYSLDLIKEEIGFPLVVKTLAGMRGMGVFLCDSENCFIDLMGIIGMQSPQKPLIAQEFIASSYGMDVRVFILGNEVIGCMKRVGINNFKANFSIGGKVEPFAVDAELKKISIDCARLFGLEIAGIDLLFSKGGYVVCEANSSPGFKGMEQITQTDIAEQILQYVVANI